MSNLPATMPHDASLVYARNIQALVFEFVQKGELKLNMENEIIRETVVKGNA
jgi:NAD/NADP transhydrogenase alpha subunit